MSDFFKCKNIKKIIKYMVYMYCVFVFFKYCYYIFYYVEVIKSKYKVNLFMKVLFGFIYFFNSLFLN